MQNTVNISGLESLIAPEQISTWPPAPVWFVISGLVLLTLLLLLLNWIRRRRENRYRLLAMNQLKEIGALAGKQAEPRDIQALNRLLKETALSVYPREQVAPLFGKEWIDFLDSQCTKTRFSDLQGSLLESAACGKKAEGNIPADQWKQLMLEVESWIKKHTYKSLKWKE